MDGADFTEATISEDQLLKANYIGAKFDIRKFDKIYKEYKERHDECSKDVRRIGLALLAFAIFCFLAMGKAGEKLLVDNEVKIPFADVPADFQTFMIVGPLALLLITGYFHLFIHELHRYRGLPQKFRLPFAFNLDNPFAKWLSNLVFYFLTPAVLFVFSFKSRVLPVTGDFWHYSSWVVAAYLIYVYWKHNLNLKKTIWGKSGSIVYGLILLALGSILTEQFRERPIRLAKEAPLAARDFSGWNLKGLQAYKANLKEANLTKADLTEANLTEANLTEANLKKANLAGTNLEYAKLSGTNLTGANLEKANLKKANLFRANLENARLTRTNLEGVNLEKANLTEANLTGANLENTRLYYANLTGANLEKANLTGAILYKANLNGANLKNTNLNGANLTETQHLRCNQINSAKALNSKTLFPKYLKVSIIGDNKWTCEEF